MSPFRIIFSVLALIILGTSYCFSQSSAIKSLRIQYYSSAGYSLHLREISYSFQKGQFIADSILICNTQYYETVEQKRAAERTQKNRRYRKQLRGIAINFGRAIPVDTVKLIHDTLPAFIINNALENLNTKRNVKLSSLNITENDINSHIEKWRRRPTTRLTWAIDSVAKILTPEYELSEGSLDSCETLCTVQSHGGFHSGVRIYVENENGQRNQITSVDKCNALPMTHLVNLLPIFESLPEKMLLYRGLYGKKMILDLSVAAILSKLEGRKCMFMVR